MVQEAREEFDVVLLDTGPIPRTVESSIAATSADEVIVVVSRGEQRPIMERTLDALKSVGVRLAGIVFNRADKRDVARAARHIASCTSPEALRLEDDVTTTPGAPEALLQRFDPVTRAVAATSLLEGEQVRSPGDGNQRDEG